MALNGSTHQITTGREDGWRSTAIRSISQSDTMHVFLPNCHASGQIPSRTESAFSDRTGQELTKMPRFFGIDSSTGLCAVDQLFEDECAEIVHERQV